MTIFPHVKIFVYYQNILGYNVKCEFNRIVRNYSVRNFIRRKRKSLNGIRRKEQSTSQSFNTKGNRLHCSETTMPKKWAHRVQMIRLIITKQDIDRTIHAIN